MKCKFDSCETILSEGCPEYCPDHNDFNLKVAPETVINPQEIIPGEPLVIEPNDVAPVGVDLNVVPIEEVKIGRPSLWTQELADIICEKLSEGVSLRTVCLDEDMPDARTVFRWLRTNEQFCQQYARAKQESADAMAEDVLDIADDGSNDWMEKQVSKGVFIDVPNNEVLQRSKLRVDTRKWLMSKMKPKKYGEKMDVTSDGKAIKGNSIVFTDFSNEAESK